MPRRRRACFRRTLVCPLGRLHFSSAAAEGAVVCASLDAAGEAPDLRYFFDDYVLDLGPARAASRRWPGRARAEGFRPSRLSHPQPAARGQQGRSVRSGVAGALRLRIGIDHADQCGTQGGRGQRRGAAAHPHAAPQGLPLRRCGARGSEPGAAASAADIAPDPPAPALALPDRPSTPPFAISMAATRSRSISPTAWSRTSSRYRRGCAGCS